VVKKLSYSDKEELNEEEYFDEDNEVLTETTAVSRIMGIVSSIWLLGGIIVGVINFFKSNWMWGIEIIFISLSVVTLFAAVSKMMQLLCLNYMFMISTHENIEELSEKMQLKNMFVEVIKKKRR